MIVNRERTSCVGRPFSSPAGSGDTFLDNFYNWITRVPVGSPVAKSTGGPRWYIIDDQSPLATNPYIVISNHQDIGTGLPDTPAGEGVSENPNKFDEPHKILKIEAPSAQAARVNIYGYAWWDKGTQTGYLEWFRSYINTVQDDIFLYDFRGGPDFITIGANNNSSWSFQFLGDFDEDTTFVENRTVAAAMTGPIGASGSPVTITFSSSGEANLFTKNKFYFIYDFDGVAKAEYRQCTGVGVADGLLATQIQVDQIQTSGGFAAGAVVCAYAQRFIAWETHHKDNGAKTIHMPYVSSLTSSQVTRTGTQNLQEQLAMSETALITMDPDDTNIYAYDVPYAAEYLNGAPNFDDMNRIYAPLTGMYVTSPADLTKMYVGRVISSQNYLYMEDFQSKQEGITYAFMVPDFDSVS